MDLFGLRLSGCADVDGFRAFLSLHAALQVGPKELAEAFRAKEGGKWDLNEVQERYRDLFMMETHRRQRKKEQVRMRYVF